METILLEEVVVCVSSVVGNVGGVLRQYQFFKVAFIDNQREITNPEIVSKCS